MTVTFWIIAALFILIAAGFILTPLLSGGGGEARRVRRQIASLDQALADGHIDQPTHAKRLEALQAEREQTRGSSRPDILTASILGIAVALAGVGLYQRYGDPMALQMGGTSAPTRPAATAPGDEQQAPELQQAIAGLAARLEQNPEDIEGWLLLGQSYMTIGEFGPAQEALSRAYELAPDNPAVMEMLATALTLAGGAAAVPEDARMLFRQALQINPRSQRPLYFLGMAAYQDGQFADAIDYWETLQGELTQGSPQAEQLAENIAAARAELGMAGAPAGEDGFPFERLAEAEAEPAPQVETATAAPTAEAAAAPPSGETTQGAGVTVQVSLSDSLRDRVRPNDVLFVFARAAEGPKVPLAIQRLPAGSLPTTVRLDESMAMMPSMTMSSFPEIVIGARISKTGNASPEPGDLQALSDPLPSNQAHTIRLDINQVL